MVRYIQYFEIRLYFFIFLIDLKIDDAIRFVSNKSNEKQKTSDMVMEMTINQRNQTIMKTKIS
jgi:hypothetical protein